MFKNDKEHYVIAECGINHNGSIKIAKELIDLAIKCDCDAVKFQKRNVDIVYTKEELGILRESPFGSTNGDLKRGLEFNLKQYKEIDKYCKEKGIDWLCSCWDEDSVDFIEDNFNVKYHKIASASITDKELLRKIARTGKKIFLSTGMSTLNEIYMAIDTIINTKIRDTENYFRLEDIIILHCTSTYPTNSWEANLKMIETYKNCFPKNIIGYSGHERGILPSVLAASLGAKVIERHITLDRTMWGSDQASSLEPDGLYRMVRDIRAIKSLMGDGIKQVYESELPIIKKLRRVK